MVGNPFATPLTPETPPPDASAQSPSRRVLRANRRPNRPPPKPHWPPRGRIPPTHSFGHQDPTPPPPPARSPDGPVPCDERSIAPSHSAPQSRPSWECHRNCAASTPSRRSPKRVSYPHAAQRSSYASRTSLWNRRARGVYSRTFLPLRGMGSSSPWEGGPHTSRTPSTMS